MIVFTNSALNAVAFEFESKFSREQKEDSEIHRFRVSEMPRGADMQSTKNSSNSTMSKIHKRRARIKRSPKEKDFLYYRCCI